jgi:hypothetical protein
MIPLAVTVCFLLASMWALSLTSAWLAAFWGVWSIAGLAWFCANIGRKNGPDRWYDTVLLAPVFPYAWMFGVTKRLCQRLKGHPDGI